MLLLHLSDLDEQQWRERLAKHLGDYPIILQTEEFDPKAIKYILAWKPKAEAFDGLGNLDLVLSLGAGVDALLAHPNLPDLPIVRFVDEELTNCMSDYVMANVSMHHRAQHLFLAEQNDRTWQQYYPPSSNHIHVGIMGLGELGEDAAKRLTGLGYRVFGWSRSAKEIEGVTSFAGADQFDHFLAQCDILVNLLPLTAATQNILNQQTFSKLRRGMKGGPTIINAARGGHNVEDDIVAALRSGELGAASLDVFQTEPLPKDSALWDAPNCFITPHIAAISHPDTGARYFSNVILEHQDGKPLRNVVDRAKGY